MTPTSHLQNIADRILRLNTSGFQFESANLENTFGDASNLSAVHKVLDGDLDKLSPEETFQLEAIVETQWRPVSFIRGGRFEDLPRPWQHFNSDPIRGNLHKATAAVGRIELISASGSTSVHVGTGFLVSDHLVMTNRHVAEIFCAKTASLDGNFLVDIGIPPAIDFGRELGFDPGDLQGTLRIERVLMVHPYWDIALLELNSAIKKVEPLVLSARENVAPADARTEVAVIGYPGKGTARYHVPPGHPL